MAENQSVYSMWEQRSITNLLVAESCKPCKIYKKNVGCVCRKCLQMSLRNMVILLRVRIKISIQLVETERKIQDATLIIQMVLLLKFCNLKSPIRIDFLEKIHL